VSKVPVVSFQEVLRALGKIGYAVARQKGSHVRLRASGRAPVTVPAHDPVAPGTLRNVLKTAGISIDEFIELLNR